MRKLRRLPWRIPKSHKDHQPTTSVPAEGAPRVEPQIEVRESANTQPVAFAGGRYVYGMEPSVACSTEIRRKARHRILVPLAAGASR